jgi:hypothetical protein
MKFYDMTVLSDENLPTDWCIVRGPNVLFFPSFYEMVTDLVNDQKDFGQYFTDLIKDLSPKERERVDAYNSHFFTDNFLDACTFLGYSVYEPRTNGGLNGNDAC